MALKLEIAQMELHQLFNVAGDPMWVVDRNRRVQRVNDRMLTLLQKTREEVVGKTCRSLLDLNLCGTKTCPLINVRKGQQELEVELHKDPCGIGRVRNFLLTASPFFGFMGEIIGVVISYKDITKRKEMERELRDANVALERLTTLDGLTNITNRRGLDEYLRREWGRMRRNKTCLSFLMGDIDFFKCYNDTYGHQAGDDCLRALAGALQQQVLRSSDLAARYGGEEFAVVLPDTGCEGALQVAERIRSTVEELRIESKCSPISDQVTLSLGVGCIIPGPDNSPAELIKRADNALYLAKKNGRNQVVIETISMISSPVLECVGIDAASEPATV